MNNPNPFVPKGSLLEQQSQRRSRLKLAVFCVLAVSVTGLVAMLIQGCKREKPPENPDQQMDRRSGIPYSAATFASSGGGPIESASAAWRSLGPGISGESSGTPLGIPARQ